MEEAGAAEQPPQPDPGTTLLKSTEQPVAGTEDLAKNTENAPYGWHRSHFLKGPHSKRSWQLPAR